MQTPISNPRPREPEDDELDEIARQFSALHERRMVLLGNKAHREMIKRETAILTQGTPPTISGYVASIER